MAESTLIPIDNALNEHGLQFLRYADDIVIFVDDRNAARSAFARVAQTLDRQQRLTLQRHKSQIYTGDAAYNMALRMVEDQPISEDEADLLRIIEKYSRGDPYQTIWFSDISDEDWLSITHDTLDNTVEAYLSESYVDYAKLSWFYRRLAQIGHPGALQVTLRRLDLLIPCLPAVIAYIASVRTIEAAEWAKVGDELFALLENEVVENQEYYEVMLLSLFARNSDIDHFVRIGQRYNRSSPAGRRQILLAAKKNGAIDWLREFKEDFPSMDSGQKYAFLYAMADFPTDERKYFIQRYQTTTTRPFEVMLARAAKLEQKQV